MSVEEDRELQMETGTLPSTFPSAGRDPGQGLHATLDPDLQELGGKTLVLLYAKSAVTCYTACI